MSYKVITLRSDLNDDMDASPRSVLRIKSSVVRYLSGAFTDISLDRKLRKGFSENEKHLPRFTLVHRYEVRTDDITIIIMFIEDFKEGNEAEARVTILSMLLFHHMSYRFFQNHTKK